jgi:hypothetical protein
MFPAGGQARLSPFEQYGPAKKLLNDRGFPEADGIDPQKISFKFCPAPPKKDMFLFFQLFRDRRRVPESAC